MANALYQLWTQEIMKGTSNALLNSAEGTTGVYAALVDTGVYTFSQAHQFYSDLTGIIGTPVEITAKTQALGVFDGADVTFTGVTGNSAEAIVLYRRNAGANTTWPLITYLDSGYTNLPVTPNSGNIAIAWPASGIFKL